MTTPSFKRIKCHTTEVPISKSVSEIENMLAAFGARRIVKDYNDAREVTSIGFIIATVHGDVPVKLPAEVSKVRQVLREQAKAKLIPKRFDKNPWANKRAARVAWRVLRDWLYAQLTLIQVEMTKPEQIFLPYVYSEKRNKTLFEMFEEDRFQGVLGTGQEAE